MSEILPECVSEKLAREGHEREDKANAIAILASLDVPESSLFWRFYSTYEGGFGSAKVGYEILALAGGGENVVTSTETCRVHHQFPNQFIVFSEMIAWGILVYDTNSGRVFDVDFEGGDQLLKDGTLQPRWQTFADFLVDYFC